MFRDHWSTALARCGAGGLAVLNLWWGVWARLWPSHFFDTFPGFGHRWTAAYPPYNEHLVTDLGSTFLTLGFLLSVAALTTRLPVRRLAFAAVLLFNLLHLGFHAGHQGTMGGFDLSGEHHRAGRGCAGADGAAPGRGYPRSWPVPADAIGDASELAAPEIAFPTGVPKAIPYGVYDIGANEGFVSVSVDHDTAAFAVSPIRQWWRQLGRDRYPTCARTGQDNREYLPHEDRNRFHDHRNCHELAAFPREKASKFK